MSIKKEMRSDYYAYWKNGILADAVTDLKEGQWVTFDTDGKLVIAGTDAVKAFLCISSKRTGRDQISGKPARSVSYLQGAFDYWVDQYDAEGTYTAAVTPLKLTSTGTLTPATITGATPDAFNKVVAWAIGGPSTDGFLHIISA